jgi:hypothetical protein
MTETGSALRFDRADYEKAPGAGPRCGVCKGPLAPEYWRWQGVIFCSACRPKVGDKIAESQSRGAYAKAALQGAGVALACGIGYAVFVGVTKMQLALVTIGIAYVVARVVRKASGGLGGKRFQILAVALTYFASTMGYAPGIIKGVREMQAKREAAAVYSTGSDDSPAYESARDGNASEAHGAAPPASDAAGHAHTATPRGGMRSMIFGLAFLLGLMLAAPFLEITSAPIGVIIVLIGLWQAWKLTRGVPIAIEGPYRVAPPAGVASGESAKVS